MWNKVKKIFGIDKNENKSQVHFGEGDNIAGNKIINLHLEPQKVDDFTNYHIKQIKSNRKLAKETLQVTFEKFITYPKINFSITNKSGFPIQITGINCIKVSCIKNKEKNELDYLTGPRLKL